MNDSTTSTSRTMRNHVVTPRHLVLWDIDHTLIRAGDFHTHLYRHAFEQTVGRPPLTLINMSGRTDRESITITLRRNGVDPTLECLEAFAAALVDAIDAQHDLLMQMGQQTDGAEAALLALAADPTLTQTVVTGNLKPLAIAKLSAFELASHLDFDIGGYGWDSLHRGDLVRAARQRAADKHHTDYPPSATIVIGDTPKDVQAAHTGGATIIAVATGKSSPEELREAGAERVLPDLTDLDNLRDTLHEIWHPTPASQNH